MSVILTIGGRNDLLRSTFLTGRVVMTEGIRALPNASREEALSRVRSFDAFTPDNDPYGEHDFGSFDLPDAGRVFWKIDYYDRTMTRGSDDPANPAVTTRVLTVMLAEEW